MQLLRGMSFAAVLSGQVSRCSNYVRCVIHEYDLEVPKVQCVRPFHVILRNVAVNKWCRQVLKILAKTALPPFVMSARRIMVKKHDHV